MLLSVILCNYVDEGNINKIKDLLFNIEDLTQIHDYDFRTPLHIASVKNRADIAHLLINRGAKINCVDRWKRTPLQEAIIN
jgi:ankyrin repeat protein